VKRFSPTRAILSAVLILAFFVPAFAQMEVEPLNPREKVVVAYVPIMKFATMYVAAERGLFDAQGLDVEINRVASGTEAIAFLSEGQIDVGGIAIVTSLWNGWNQGLDIRVIAPGAREPFEDSPTKLVVRTDLFESGAVTEIADLRGRTVAVAGGPGSGGEYLAAKALERAGLTIRDVNLINVANPDAPAALEGKAIDATILGSPYAQQVEEAGYAVELAGDLTPGAMTVTFVASDKFVTERPEVAQRFALALLEAARLMQGDDFMARENVDAYLRYVNATEEAIEGDRLLVFDPDQVIPVDDLADVERTHRENGRTEYEEALDLSGIVNNSFTDWAREVAGPYEAQ
jgi:NitT/TauT family transport system substrate-binding protein